MDKSYLRKRRQTWYVRVRVPPPLVDAVGKSHFERSLKTRDLATANRIKHQHIAELKGYFATLQEQYDGGKK